MNHGTTRSIAKVAGSLALACAASSVFLACGGGSSEQTTTAASPSEKAAFAAGPSSDDPALEPVALETTPPDAVGMNANFDDYADLPEERTMEADLDGDGEVELIAVQLRAQKAFLTVGSHQKELPAVYIQVVDLTPNEPGKLLAASGNIDEGDLIAIEFFRLTPDGLESLGKVDGNQHFTKVRDGVLVHDETNCGQRHVVRWELRGKLFVKAHEEKTGDFDEDQCAG